MRQWKNRLGVAAAGSCLALVSVLPASAASTQWRISYIVSSSSDQIDGVTAPSSLDAWAFGTRYSSGDLEGSFYLRWTPSGWRQATVPHPAGFAPLWIASSSPDNVWIVGGNKTRPGYHALVYNGSSWRTLAVPADGLLSVLGSDNVWVNAGRCQYYGGSPVCSTKLYHWNGSTWRSYTLPAWGLNLVGAGRHVWFVAVDPVTSTGPPYETGREALFRWSGGGWQRVAAPDRGIIGSVPAAASPGGKLWLLAKSLHAKTLHLDYWDGHSWSAHSAPPDYGPYPDDASASYDGRDGIWIGSDHWTGTRWIQTLPPGSGSNAYGVWDAAPIPGTASVWGIGQKINDELAVIAAYGSLP